MGCVRKDEAAMEVEAPTDEVAAAAAAKKQRKQERKKLREAAEAEAESPAEADDEATAAAEAKRKRKEEKKRKRAEAEAAEAAAVAAPEKPSKKAVADAAEEQPKKKKKQTDVLAAAPAATALKKFKDHSSHPFYKENNVTVSDVPAPQPATTFAESMLGDTITTYLQTKFKGGTPSPIQSVSWPLILQGHDVFGIAKTGSGKTLAFLLPFLAKSESDPAVAAGTKKNQPRLLALAPTKELVQQIAEVAVEFSNILGKDKYPVQCIIGGMPKYEQKQSIQQKGCDILIASPGRVLDLVENDQAIDLSKIQLLILDEADRMLDDGFIMPMRSLSQYCTDPKRQTVLFSATWPLEVSQLARGLICTEAAMFPATITVMRKGESAVGEDGSINTEDKLQLNDSNKQEVHVLKDWKQKWSMLTRELDKHSGKKIIVFGLVKKEVARIEERMNSSGYPCVAIQGDMTQPARNAAFEQFKSSKVKILVATDVAARGLDIPDVEVVLNYTFPLTVEDWVHRTGRTGRAGKKGLAITFFNEAGEFNEVNHCFDIIRLLESVKQPVPPELKTLDSKTFTATKKKGHALYGNFFKTPEEMARLEKKKVHVTFDNSDDE